MPIQSLTLDRHRLHRVLLVAHEPRLKTPLESCGEPRRPLTVIYKSTLAAARSYLKDHKVDVVIIEPRLGDGSGIELLREIGQKGSNTATVLLGDREDFQLAKEALRAGADDVIVQPIEPSELGRCIRDAVNRHRRHEIHGNRVERLHRLCRKLNDARVDVSRQVDVLCSDLVTAYQELASQMHQSASTAPNPQAGDYDDIVRDELDLEDLLRKTLEYLMARVGPCNAAIYLPATMDEYSLGGYVNFDCSAEMADLLLSSLADTLAPRVAEAEELVHLTSGSELERWAGRDAEDLEGRHLVAVPCDGDEECLAVLMLFRDGDTPFNEAALDLCTTLAPMMGAALERIINVHHRSLFHDDASDEAGFFDASDLELGYDDEELPF